MLIECMVDEIKKDTIGDGDIEIPEKIQSSSSSGEAVESAPFSINNLDGLFSYYEKKFEKQDSKIENQKLTIIETLGIFVALFTFISIDFQVFKSYRNPFAISGLTLILLGSVAFIISVFDFFILKARSIKKAFVDGQNIKNETLRIYLINSFKNNISRIIFIILEIFLISMGIFLFTQSKVEELSDNKAQIKSEIYSSLEADIESQKKELQDTNNNNTDIIKSSSKNIEDIKKCIRNFGVTYRCFE